LLDLIEHEVQPYHGTLQAAGNDSFLVLFGVPAALEDHARRAQHAGLALQRRLQQPYKDPGTQDEIMFEVCLGVHMGPVMVGSNPSDPQQPPTVVGEVTHLVARVQQLAAPGMLLRSEDTLRLVHGEDAPYLLQLLGVSEDAERLATLSPQTLKTRIFATLQQLCIQHGRQQPLVLAVEDLHWIDPTSEEWLASLVELLAPVPLLLLTTYRPGYRPLWTDESYATQLALTRLTPEASCAVVQSAPQTTPLSDALRREIVGKAAGNPFFLEELTRDVVAHADRRATRMIPDTVQAVLAARMDQLPPEEKRLLQTAAVIGLDVPLPLLQAVAELPDDALNRGLAHLQAVEFLYETRRFPEWEYTFKHALTHEVAYEALLQEQRRMLHVRIMTALEGLYANRLAEQVEWLAHHAIRGEVWAKAVTYGRQAGAKAVERSALREAAAAFEQALAALQHLPDSRATREQDIDLRFDLRNALHPLNEEGRILNHLRQAESLAEALGDQRRLGHLAGYLSVCLRHQGHNDEALVSAQRALAIGTALGDVGLQVTANSFLGELYLWVLNDYRQAVEAYRRNVELLHGALLRERFGTTNMQSVVARAQVARCLAELGAFAEGGGIRRGSHPAGRDGRSPVQFCRRV
jgi:predicted ATPase